MTTPTTTTTAAPVTFLDPQPTPGDPDRAWFCISSDGSGLYVVTRTSCSCPWGTHHKADLAEKPCRHLAALLHLLDEDWEVVDEGQG